MSLQGKRIFTCTPVAFHGNDFFFSRDTGLICMNLRRLGAESMAIMPLPFHEDDIREDIIRVPMEQLKSAEWWRSLHLDGLVLYSWGAPRYTAIVKAVKKAGIKLVIHLDSKGDFFDEEWKPRPSHLQRLKNLFTHTAIDFLRARHLKLADALTMSPPVAEMLRHRMFYGASVADKAVTMPCPVSPHFTYDGRAKQRKAVCVGRWGAEDEIKDPGLMMQASQLLVQKDATVVVEIYGRYGEQVAAWHAALPEGQRGRILLKGFTPSAALKDVYCDAMVSFCTSKRESSHIASAEALCCGCAVVVPARPSLNLPQWYASKDCGTVAREDTPESLADAILEELQQWEQGHRDPAAIAAYWQPLFHADKVMARIFAPDEA